MNDYNLKVILHNPAQLAQWFAANEHMAMLHCIRFSQDQGFTSAQIKEALGLYMSIGFSGLGT